MALSYKLVESFESLNPTTLLFCQICHNVVGEKYKTSMGLKQPITQAEIILRLNRT